MNHSTPLIQILALITATLYFQSFAHAELSFKRIMDKVYDGYDQRHACWLAMEAENRQRYCMKIDRTDKVAADTGQRLYILAVGNAIDENGEFDGSHVLPGLVGAFVVEEHNDQAQIVAGDPKIQIGASGSAPTQWKFIKLGPSDYWGWQNTWGDCHQGYCGSRYAILAPYGKKIRDLAGFVSSYDDAGACLDKRCTSIDSKLKVDSTQINEKVFPLLITVTGEDKDRKLAPKTWTFPFDLKKWSYIEPQRWPLKERDF
jgi:hypothetical protein